MVDTTVAKCGVCCCSVTVFFVIFMLAVSVKQVDRLNVALLKNGLTGEIDLTESYPAGRYMVGFWMDFVQVPITLNTIEFSEETPEAGVQELGSLKARDQDGKLVYMDVSVQYRIKPEKFPDIYRDMTVLFEDNYISYLRSGLQRSANQFKIEEAWNNYTRVTEIMKEQCVRVLETKNAECWDLQFWGVRLLPRYEAQLIRTQVQKQRNIKIQRRQEHLEYRAETSVLIADYDRRKTVIEAGADARQVDIERLAESTAEEALIKAQSQMLKLVRDTVVLPNATGNGSIKMNHSELMQYQRIMMLQNMKFANFALTSKGGGMKQLSVP